MLVVFGDVCSVCADVYMLMMCVCACVRSCVCTDVCVPNVYLLALASACCSEGEDDAMEIDAPDGSSKPGTGIEYTATSSKMCKLHLVVLPMLKCVCVRACACVRAFE